MADANELVARIEQTLQIMDRLIVGAPCECNYDGHGAECNVCKLAHHFSELRSDLRAALSQPSGVVEALRKALKYMTTDLDTGIYNPDECWCIDTDMAENAIITCEACIARKALALSPAPEQTDERKLLDKLLEHFGGDRADGGYVEIRMSGAEHDEIQSLIAERYHNLEGAK